MYYTKVTAIKSFLKNNLINIDIIKFKQQAFKDMNSRNLEEETSKEKFENLVTHLLSL